MARHPNIGDHGLIGDLQTAALVSTDGVLDWFCCPRFDSPSVFASLLDAERGGFYRIAPDRDDYVSRRLYSPLDLRALFCFVEQLPMFGVAVLEIRHLHDKD